MYYVCDHLFCVYVCVLFCLGLFCFGCLVVGVKNTECNFVYDRFCFTCLIAWLLLLCVWLIGFVRVLFCLGLVWVYLLGEGACYFVLVCFVLVAWSLVRKTQNVILFMIGFVSFA